MASISSAVSRPAAWVKKVWLAAADRLSGSRRRNAVHERPSHPTGDQQAAFDWKYEVDNDRIFDKRQLIFRLMQLSKNALFESRVQVRHLMSRRVGTVLPNASVDEVVKLMRQRRVRHVLVCNLRGDLVGIISDRDARGKCASTAAELMTAKPVTIAPDAAINPAITVMMRHGISCLPVLKQGRLCGVLTTTDLLLALQCTLQMLMRANAEAGGSSAIDGLGESGPTTPDANETDNAARQDEASPCESRVDITMTPSPLAPR